MVHAGGGVSNRYVTQVYERLILLNRETFADATITGAVQPAIDKVLSDQGLRPADLTADRGGRAVADALTTISGFFLSASENLEFRAKLAQLFGDQSVYEAVVVPVRGEADILAARHAAREAGERAGLTMVQTIKVVTAVSELARNIVRYTDGGEIRLNGTNRTMRVVAEDGGPGIPHLDEVLSGTYRSRQGMGQGLVGTRRLMDEFEIQTGPEGTKVTLAMRAR